jgi:anti-sigma factor RsiW
MNEYDEKWEEKINALIDGDLGALDAEALKAEATDDRELARAIIEAYQLQQAMEQVRVEPAPASLRKKLKAIPREQREKKPLFGWMQPRWAAAFAVVPLLLVSISLMQPKTPSQEEIEQARMEMAIAFAYLDKAGVITGREIEANVGNKVADAVTGSVSKTIKSQNIFSKESEV